MPDIISLLHLTVIIHFAISRKTDLCGIFFQCLNFMEKLSRRISFLHRQDYRSLFML